MAWVAVFLAKHGIPLWAIKWGAIVAAAVALFAYGHHLGSEGERDAYEKKAHVAEVKALQQEIAWNKNLLRNKETYDAEVIGVRSSYERQLASLRTRPSRMPEVAREACKGSTGTELSREDGAFLAREAARANRLQARLAQCYADQDAIYGGPPAVAPIEPEDK